MRHQAIVSIVFSSAVVLCGCDQPVAARVSPAPLHRAEVSVVGDVVAPDPVALDRARGAVRAMVLEYERPGSAFHAQVGQAAVRAQAALGGAGTGSAESRRASALRAMVRKLAEEGRAHEPAR